VAEVVTSDSIEGKKCGGNPSTNRESEVFQTTFFFRRLELLLPND
jgi:hypothetical protein